MFASSTCFRLCTGLYCPHFITNDCRSLTHRARRAFRLKIQRPQQKPIEKPTTLHAEEALHTGPVVERSVKDLLRPLAFTVGVGCVFYAGAAIAEHERRRKFQEHHTHPNNWAFREQPRRFLGFRDHVSGIWKQLSDGQKLVAVLVTVNGFIWALWKVPALRPFMYQYFTCSPYKKNQCVPMLLSVFSHRDFLHLFLNMYVLQSFAVPVVDRVMGLEQFCWFYVASGVASSLISSVFKIYSRTYSFSLGASGAILGVMAYTCCKFPEARLNIVFLPMFNFSATSAIYGLLVFDLSGLLFGWKLFDHAAHLGGMCTGMLYAFYAEDMLWGHRHTIVEKWEALTGARRK